MGTEYLCETVTLDLSPTASELAVKFAEIVNRYLGDHVGTINRLNATPEYADCCATHNYCDANMLMLEALASLLKQDEDDVCMAMFDEEDDKLVNLTNEAWTLARKCSFRRYEIEASAIWQDALKGARALMALGVEPRSAYKQAASDCGITYGAGMGRFVAWAEVQS